MDGTFIRSFVRNVLFICVKLSLLKVFLYIIKLNYILSTVPVYALIEYICSQKDYVCFDFVRRHHNIIRYRRGVAVIKDNFHTVCSWVQFPNREAWKFDLFLGKFNYDINLDPVTFPTFVTYVTLFLNFLSEKSRSGTLSDSW